MSKRRSGIASTYSFAKQTFSFFCIWHKRESCFCPQLYTYNDILCHVSSARKAVDAIADPTPLAVQQSHRCTCTGKVHLLSRSGFPVSASRARRGWPPAASSDWQGTGSEQHRHRISSTPFLLRRQTQSGATAVSAR